MGIVFLLQLTVLGTPAEEGFGGKVEMAEKGAFKDVDLAMMVHPTTFNSVCGELFLAVDQSVDHFLLSLE